jgi:IS30 family transposase
VERLSEREKQEIERLSALGLPSRLIGKQIGRHHRTVWGHISRLRRPPAREPVRCALRLSLAEREEISRGLVGSESLRAIARRLGRSPSTVSREVAANGGRKRYRACSADRAAVRRMVRPKVSKLAACARLRAVVEAKLALRWSPQQISGWLVETFPFDPEMRVSHETIYLSLFVQSRGALRKELACYLRSGHTTRRPQGHSVMNGQGQLRGTLNISERPAEANDRAVPGHWEGDLLMGKRMHAMATLVERKTRFVMLIALPDGHAADVVADALATKITELPEQLRRSLYLGSRQRDGRPRAVHRQDGPARLFLRSAQSLAAWQQREHQRPVTAVLPQTLRDRALHPSRSRRRRGRAQRKASTNPRMEDTITSTRRSVAMNP